LEIEIEDPIRLRPAAENKPARFVLPLTELLPPINRLVPEDTVPVANILPCADSAVPAVKLHRTLREDPSLVALKIETHPPTANDPRVEVQLPTRFPLSTDRISAQKMGPTTDNDEPMTAFRRIDTSDPIFDEPLIEALPLSVISPETDRLSPRALFPVMDNWDPPNKAGPRTEKLSWNSVDPSTVSELRIFVEFKTCKFDRMHAFPFPVISDLTIAAPPILTAPSTRESEPAVADSPILKF